MYNPHILPLNYLIFQLSLRPVRPEIYDTHVSFIQNILWRLFCFERLQMPQHLVN